MTSLGEKLIAKLGAERRGLLRAALLADVYRTKTSRPVNDPAALQGDDLLLVNGRVKAAEFAVAADRPKRGGRRRRRRSALRPHRQGRPGQAQDRLDRRPAGFGQGGPARGQANCRPRGTTPGTWCWPIRPNWRSISPRPAAAASRAQVEEPNAIRGSQKDVYVAPGAVVHPMVVIDAEHGPVYLDEGVEVHPFTRIEGPCYVGKKSILLGTKCREGNSIGPMCRVGGEVEESIIHGYSNKYHDGFLGHAYVGEWVNLGALTTNSDLKNDYSSVTRDPRRQARPSAPARPRSAR